MFTQLPIRTTFAALLAASLLTTATAHADDEDPPASAATPLAQAKEERSSGIGMRAAGIVILVGGLALTAGGVALHASCQETYNDSHSCLRDQVGGIALGTMGVPTAITGLVFTIVGQSRISKSDERLRSLAILPNLSPTSAGFSMTGTF